MSTVLRVKRRAEEAPQEALVLLSKRLKTESSGYDGTAADLARNVFVFTGTISAKENTEDNIEKLMKKNSCRKEDPITFKNTKDILEKIKQKKKEISDKNRYEILNVSRGLKEDCNKEESYAVVDIARTTQGEEKDTEYAYDLYFTQKALDVSTVDELVQIADLEMEMIFGSYRDNGRRTPSEHSSVSSDDSNDENNWRNDYPDTEGSSVGEEDMRKAVEDIHIGNFEDLSDDEGEDRIYDDPTVEIPEINTDDVQRYGLAYAKYKARVLAASNIEDNGNLMFCKAESDEESSEGEDKEDGFYYGMEEDTEQFIEQYRRESESEKSD